MKILELDRKEAREVYNNNYKKMIAQNDGVLYDDERIKKAFNFDDVETYLISIIDTKIKKIVID